MRTPLFRNLKVCLEEATRCAVVAKDKRSTQQLALLQRLQRLLSSSAKLQACDSSLTEGAVKQVSDTHEVIREAEAFTESVKDIEHMFLSMPDLPCHISDLDGLLLAPDALLSVSLWEAKNQAKTKLQHWSKGLLQSAKDVAICPSLDIFSGGKKIPCKQKAGTTSVDSCVKSQEGDIAKLCLL